MYKLILLFGLVLFREKCADVILHTNGPGRHLDPQCPPTYCLGDQLVVTCTTNGTTVQSWTSSSTSPSTVFSLDASLVNDTIALVNNSMVMFVVHFKAASVEYKMMTSVLSVIVSAKIVGTVLQCADNTENYTGVHIASLLFQEFNGKYRKITRCALMKCSPAVPPAPIMSSYPITNITCMGPKGVSLTVHWFPSGNTCGDPGLYYNVSSPQLGLLCSYLPANVTSCDLSGLGVNVSYDVHVKVVNCAGSSPPLVIPVKVPGRTPDPVVFNPPCSNPSQIKLPAPVAPDIPLGQEATITCTGPGCIVTTSTATSAIVVGVVKNGTYSVGVSLRNCVGRGGVAVTDNIVIPLMEGWEQSQNSYCVPLWETETNISDPLNNTNTEDRLFNDTNKLGGQASYLTFVSISSAASTICFLSVIVLAVLSIWAHRRRQKDTLKEIGKHDVMMEENTSYGTHTVCN
eukprot:Em0039g8a